MARKPSARVVLNRAAVGNVLVAIADGLFHVGKAIIEEARPPDATPFGEGLVTSGGVLAYVGDKKVAGWGQDGKQPKKPRAAKVKGSASIQAIAGFGFPGRFQEFGTVNHGAQPFLTPSRDQVLPRAAAIMEPIVSADLKAIR